VMCWMTLILESPHAEIDVSDQQATSILGLVFGLAPDVWSIHSPCADQELAQFSEFGVWFICCVHAVRVRMVCHGNSVSSCKKTLRMRAVFSDRHTDTSPGPRAKAVRERPAHRRRRAVASARYAAKRHAPTHEHKQTFCQCGWIGRGSSAYDIWISAARRGGALDDGGQRSPAATYFDPVASSFMEMGLEQKRPAGRARAAPARRKELLRGCRSVSIFRVTVDDVCVVVVRVGWSGPCPTPRSCSGATKKRRNPGMKWVLPQINFIEVLRPMSVPYTAVLEVSEDSVLFLSALLHAERLRPGTRGGRRVFEHLPAGRTGVALVSGRHPDVHAGQGQRGSRCPPRMITGTRASRYSRRTDHRCMGRCWRPRPPVTRMWFLDGTLIHTDRISIPGPHLGGGTYGGAASITITAANVQVISAPGWLAPVDL